MTALTASQESRQQPCWPPMDSALALGKSLPLCEALGLKSMK